MPLNHLGYGEPVLSKVLIIFILFTSMVPLYGQDDSRVFKPNEEMMTASLKSSLEEKINRYLARYLPKNAFDASVTVEFNNETNLTLPYVPSSAGRSLSGLSIPTLLRLSKGLKIAVFVSDTVGSKDVKSLKQLLKSKFDSPVTIKKMAMGFVADEGSKQKISKLEQDLRQLNSDKQLLERERNDMKTELALSKKEGGEGGLSGLIMPIVVVLLSIIGLLVASKMFSGAISSIGGGITSVAQSVEALGSALSGENDETEVEKDAGQAAGTQTAPANSSASTEETRSLVQKISEELREAINAENRHILVKYVSELLGRQATHGKAVALLEMVGPEHSAEIFEILSNDLRESVTNFLNTGNYGQPKASLMIEAADTLKTKLLGKNFHDSQSGLSIKVAEQALNLTEDDILELSASMDDDMRARFLLYYSPDRLAQIISTCKSKRDDQAFSQLLNAMKNAAAGEEKRDLDSTLESKLAEIIELKSKDRSMSRLRHYKNVLADLDDSIASEAMELLAKDDQTVRSFLERNIVTFATLFKLPDEFRESLVIELNNKEIASLIWGASEDQKTAIQGHLDERRVPLVEEERETIDAMNKRNAQKIFDKAKAKIVAKLKKLGDQGELEELLNEPSNGAVKEAA